MFLFITCNSLLRMRCFVLKHSLCFRFDEVLDEEMSNYAESSKSDLSGADDDGSHLLDIDPNSTTAKIAG